MTGSTRHPLATALAAGLLLLAAAPAAARPPLVATYSGTFTITFGTGPGGTNDLRFTGTGLGLPLGPGTLVGHSVLRPTAANPLVSDIVADLVTLTGAGGDQIALVNSGQDTLDVSDPARPFIYGAGTFTVGGGAGRYRQATGQGLYVVYASVTQQTGASASGTFRLVFVGGVTR